MSIVNQIKKIIEHEYKRPDSKYGYDPFNFHIKEVVKISKKLAKKLDADAEIVELAAWMHDSGSVVHGRDDHHITSSKLARAKLLKLNYPKQRIDHICNCILTHRGSQKLSPKTLEAQILVEADTISAFNDLTGLFQCAFTYEKLSRQEAKQSVLNKLNNKWEQLKFAESKKMVTPKYRAIKLLLSNESKLI